MDYKRIHIDRIKKAIHKQNENTYNDRNHEKEPTEILEPKNTIFELEILVESFDNIVDQANEIMSNWEGKSFEII